MHPLPGTCQAPVRQAAMVVNMPWGQPANDLSLVDCAFPVTAAFIRRKADLASHPPAIAPTMSRGSVPDMTASGSGASGCS